MTTTLSQPQQQDTPPAALPGLSTLSTLQDPENLQMIRTLMAQVQWHQNRRTLHQQVLGAYIEARQHKQQQWDQQDSQHRTIFLSEEQEV